MKGYKVFNPDWTCRGFQFEVGKVFEKPFKPQCCNRGFHFCKKLVDCFNYYHFKPDNKVAEIEALGDIDVCKDKSKYCTNKISIVRELTWQEVLDLVNSGKDCTGICNSGNYNSGNHNSGNYNSGDYNSGDRNSGCRNTGDYNSGDRNSGCRNTGNYNSGNCNSGNYNSGDYNSGNYNSGNCNSGNYNSGDYNSGDYNSEHCNSGDFNSGNYNSGDYNSGDYNSGHCNSGDFNSGNCNSGNYNSGNYNSGNFNSGSCNSGDWNKTSFSNGCFNTKFHNIFLFDKPSSWTLEDWINSEARKILNRIPSNCLSWIQSENMTYEERVDHLEYRETGGFLRRIEKESERQMWWGKLSDLEKKIILKIPNFDKDIFKEITGIDVEAKNNNA